MGWQKCSGIKRSYLVLLKKVYALTTRMFCGPWKPATVTAISTA